MSASPGQGLFLLGSVARESGSPSRPYESLDAITSQLTSEIIEQAVENHNASLYPASFVGELLYSTYEKRRVQRETEAVRVIEDWYCAMIDALRAAYSRRLIRQLFTDAQTASALEEERRLAVWIISEWYRNQTVAYLSRHTRRRRATARAVVQDAMEAYAVTQEAQWYHDAALSIQQCARLWMAKRLVNQRKSEREQMYRLRRETEAVETIHRTLKAYHDKHRYERSRKERLEAELQQMRQEAATSVQAVFRGWRGKRAYQVAQSTRKNNAAAVIQRCFRCGVAREQLAELRVLAAWAKRRDTLHEAAIAIQSHVRRMITRKQFLAHMALTRLAPVLQRIGRGLLARRDVRIFWQRLLAATRIQAVARGMLQRHRYRKLRSTRNLSRGRARLNHAARMIQRQWRFFAAKIALHRRRIEYQLEVAAAKKLQRHARMWVAKILLRNLREQSEDAAFDQLVHRSAVTIQSNVRGWMARSRVQQIRSRLQDAASIILAAAESFTCRRDLGRLYNRYRRNICAVKIQRAYRHWVALRMADRRHHMRVAYIRGMRQRDMAAVAIQCAYRRFRTRRQYLMTQRFRHRMATKIQTQVRMMFARDIVGVLLEEHRQDLAARRIQMVWLGVVHQFRQRREIRELELELLSMERTSMLRKEIATREDLVKAEHDWWCREQFRFQTNWRLLQEAYSHRLAEWKRLNPIERQAEAATTIQANIRGLLSRRKNHQTTAAEDDAEGYAEAEELLRQFDTDKAKGRTAGAAASDRRWSLTELARGLRAMNEACRSESAEAINSNDDDTRNEDEGATAKSSAVRPLSPVTQQLGYHSWSQFASEHRHVLGCEGGSERASGPHAELYFSASKFRSAERLLARETNARRTIIEEQDALRALLVAKAVVPPNAHLRPLWMVANRPTGAPTTTTAFAVDASDEDEDDRPASAAPSSTTSVTTVGASRSNTLPQTPPVLRMKEPRTTYPLTNSELLLGNHSRAQLQGVRSSYRKIASDVQRPALELSPLTLPIEPTESHLLEDRKEGALTAAPRQPHLIVHRLEHEVDLRNKNLTEQQLQVVLAALRTNSTATVVLLDGNPLGDHSCRDVADLLGQLPTLERLSLCGWNITDTGVTHLISSLRRLMDQTTKAKGKTVAPSNPVKSALVAVDLRDTLVTEPYRAHLASLLQQNEALIASVRSMTEEELFAAQFAEPQRWTMGLRSLPPKPLRQGGGGGLAPLRVGRVSDRPAPEKNAFAGTFPSRERRSLM